MRTKIFVSLLCCLTTATFEVNCHHNTVENHKGTQHMPKLTIEQVQEKYQDQWMAIPGVVAVGIGAVDDKPVIKVMVVQKTSELEQKIPKRVEGYPVELEETGEIRALKRN